jgi:predicted RNase H-like HicB family nuclease/DNA-binding XRE family transcriptional regulator
MRLHGTLTKDGKFWLAEIPLLDAMTQGRTKAEALEMVRDLLASLVDDPRFEAAVHVTQEDACEIAIADPRPIIALLLRRQRARSGLSLAQVAERLGATSRNSYARYEQGASQPTLTKLNQLLRAVAPDFDLVLDQAPART